MAATLIQLVVDTVLCVATIPVLFILAGAVGIEPTSTVLETAVLPLNYAPVSVALKPPKHIISHNVFICQQISFNTVDNLLYLFQ